MFLQPSLHLGVLVRSVVVDDEMHFALLWCSLVNEPQELQPFLMAVLVHAGSDDGAVQYIQCGKQRRRAMAFVIMSHRLAATFL